MFFNFFKTKVSQVNTLFLGHYVDPKVFYAVQFNKVPCISFIGELDTSKAFDFIQSTYRSELKGIYQHNYFDRSDRIRRQYVRAVSKWENGTQSE